MTDPDQRNITDQRHADDAATRYQTERSGPRTNPQWLDYFGEHYGDTYTVAAPTAPGGQWQAIALSGQHDQLFGWSPTELLDELTEHRTRNHLGQLGTTLRQRPAPKAPRGRADGAHLRAPVPTALPGVHDGEMPT